MQIKLPEFTMAYDEGGATQPVLFIHGYPLNRAIWAGQVSGLASAARVLAPDLRGHGQSGQGAGPVTVESLADDCAAFLEALGIAQPAVVCGLSMGGYVAFAFYRRHRQKVAGLILTATRAGADSADGKANRDKAAATAREKGAGAIAEAMLPKMLAPNTYESSPGLAAQVKAIMEGTPVDTIVNDLMAMKERPDSTPLLAEISVPTLILHGAADQLIPPSEAEVMHKGIQNSQLQLIPNSGHLLNMEQPEAFNQAVKQFVVAM